MSKTSIADYIMALDDPGELADPVGSVSWARAMRERLTQLAHRPEVMLQTFQGALRTMDAAQGWKQLDNEFGHPFPSLRTFCAAPPPYGLGFDPEMVGAILEETRALVLGQPFQQYVAEAEPKEGRRSKLENFASLRQAERAARNRVGVHTQRKLDLLAGYQDDSLLAQVQAGTLSIDKAYRIAKGKIPDTPIQKLKRAWDALTPEEKQLFFADVCTDERDRAMLAEQLAVVTLPG
jgi:hypothetical protein